MWFQGNIQTILSIFLCRTHNSICDERLNISGRCVKVFVDSPNTIPKNSVIFIIYNTMKLMNDTLRNPLRSLQYEPSPDEIHKVMQLLQFEDIVVCALTFGTGSDGAG